MRKSAISALAGLGLAALAVISLHLAPIAWQVTFFGLVFVLFYEGHALGEALTRRAPVWMSFPFGVFSFLALQSLAQTAWYYLGGLQGTLGDSIAICFAIAVTHITIALTSGEKPTKEPAPSGSTWRNVIGLILLVGSIVAFVTILQNANAAATIETIRTPWPLLPKSTLWMVAGLWGAMLVGIAVTRSVRLAAIQSAMAIGATTFLTPLIYKIGFGFDGFLHIASEKIMLTTGTLNPKPFYYIGQYVFTTWLARMSSLPVDAIDRWLVPVAAAILIPLVITLSFVRSSRSAWPFAVALLIPLGGFIATTPQGFSYLLGMCALILAAGVAKKTIHPVTPLIFAAWGIAIHPLAGFPILFICIAILLRSISVSRATTILSWISVLAAVTVVPLLFVILSFRGGTSIQWDASTLLYAQPWIDRLTSLVPWIGNHFVVWPAWASLVDQALPIFLLVLAIGNAILHQRDANRTPTILIVSAIGLWISATALKTTGEFTFLINYERSNYADRVNMLALFCLVPAAIPTIVALGQKIKNAPKIITVALLGFCVAIPTAIAYDSLPRNDAMVVGHGWSTSADDIETVKHIDRDANGRTYTVLADQSVSAAAVATLGFKRYAGDVFFYPIPTGGPLYDAYLHMTYNEPSRDTAKDAARLGQSDLVYVVVNDYWWRADAVSESLANISDAAWATDDGKVRVYTFDFKIPSNASATTSGR